MKKKTMTNPNEPINPIESVHRKDIIYGLTKREYFAAMAMQGLLASGDNFNSIRELVVDSVKRADKLIKELNEDNSDRL